MRFAANPRQRKAAKAPITVDDGGPIATSFPDFLPLMRGLGAEVGE